MIALSLAELAEVLDGSLGEGTEGTGMDASHTVGGPVVVDSRLAEEGSLFFALRGEETDGHLFAEAAVEGGAVAIIAERPLTVGVPVIVVEDTLVALATLARHVVAKVRALGQLRVIAMTGSNGKTTTKNMVRAILEPEGEVVAPRGSFNNQVGAPLSMLGVDEQTAFLVVEMGASAPGEIAHLVSIVVPDVAIVLKVGLAHAGGFGSIQQTQKAKSEIVVSLPETAVAVLNADDELVAAMAPLTAASPVFFGLSDTADFRASDVAVSVAGTRFQLDALGKSYRVHLGILGEHNVMNAIAAIAATAQCGVDPADAVSRLEAMVRAERWRMEVLEAPNGAIIVNDAYNASPDSMVAALKTLAEITRGTHRSIAVLGEMAELGDVADEEHDRIGRLAVRLNVAKLIVVGHAARHIHNAAGLEGSWDGESVLVDSADEAYDLLRDELQRGDVVLVKSSNSAGLRLLGDRLAGIL